VHGYTVQGYTVLQLQDIQLRVTSHTVYKLYNSQHQCWTHRHSYTVQWYKVTTISFNAQGTEWQVQLYTTTV